MTDTERPRAPAKKPSANRDRLLAAARRAFAEQGYAATGTEAVVRAAGVTRGALYHQFADKRDLFEAVFVALLGELGQQIFADTMARVRHDREDLGVGTALLLDAFSTPEVRQILLLDGPVVLGAERWQALQQPLYLGLLTHALQHLVDDGTLPPQPLAPLADVISGAIMRAGLAIAAAADPQRARQEYGEALRQLLPG